MAELVLREQYSWPAGVQPTEPALPDVCSVCSEDTTLGRRAPRPRSLLEGVWCPSERVWVSESHLTNRHAPCSYPPFAGRTCTSDVEPFSLGVMTSVCYSGNRGVFRTRETWRASRSRPAGTSLAHGLEVVRLSWRRDSSGCHRSPVSTSLKARTGSGVRCHSGFATACHTPLTTVVSAP